MKKIITFTVISYLIFYATVFAQVAVNNDKSLPDTSAMLDIKSTTKGILIPRMTSTQRTAIASPAKGLLVYDSTTTSFWFYNGGAWTNLSAAGNGWSLAGNSGTDTSANFIGTIDDQPLLVKINNVYSGIIDAHNGITSWGYKAQMANTTGNYITAVGTSALSSNTSGNHNVALGSFSLFSNLSGYFNTAIGADALWSNTSGFANTANGNKALYLNTTGASNTANGNQALYNNTIGNRNTASGDGALYQNTTASYNTAYGFQALQTNSNGGYNTSSGAESLFSNTSGSINTANGYNALYANTTGNYNNAMGGYALLHNTTGFGNTASGAYALYTNTTGYTNNASGDYSLYSNTTGFYNTAMGNSALYSNTTGSNNTAIGLYADVSTGNLVNATAIGARALVTQNNSMILGSINGQNGATASTNIGIGITAPQARLHIHSANTDNFQNAKTMILEDDINTPTIRFQGIGSFSNKFCNITLETYVDNIGNPLTDLVISGNNSYPWVRFEDGITYFLGDINSGGYIYAPGFFTSSDARLKKDIQPLQDVLPDVLKLNGYTYYWKNNKDTTQQIGVLAQELQKAYPQLVATDKNGMLSVNYMGLVPVLLTAIKEQQKEIGDLTQRLEKIETVLKSKSFTMQLHNQY